MRLLFKPCKTRKHLCKGWCFNRALRNERDFNGTACRGISWRRPSMSSCQGSPESVKVSKCRVYSGKSLKLSLDSVDEGCSMGGGGRGQWASKVGDGKSGGPTGHAYGGRAWWQMRNFNIRSQGMTNPIWLGLGQLWTQWPLLSHGLMTPAAQLFAIPILCSRSQFWKHVFMRLVVQTYSPNCLVRSRMVGVWSQLGQHSKTLCSPPSKVRVYIMHIFVFANDWKNKVKN